MGLELGWHLICSYRFNADYPPTHMGLYDIAHLLALPGMVVTAPKNGAEMIDSAVCVGVHGAPDRYMEQAPRKVQLHWTGLDAAGVAVRVRALMESGAVAG